MTSFTDIFVIKLVLGGREILVGDYNTFKDADDDSYLFKKVLDDRDVRVEVWSNRIARRYGTPIHRNRFQPLLDKIVMLDTGDVKGINRLRGLLLKFKY